MYLPIRYSEGACKSKNADKIAEEEEIGINGSRVMGDDVVIEQRPLHEDQQSLGDAQKHLHEQFGVASVHVIDTETQQSLKEHYQLYHPPQIVWTNEKHVQNESFSPSTQLSDKAHGLVPLDVNEQSRSAEHNYLT